METIIQTHEQQEMWAIVELMGHGQTAGIISPPGGNFGGLWQVDVPNGNGGFVTELYGEKSIYRVKFVSEEIARAYAPTPHEVTAYDAPIITREQHESVVRQLRDERHGLKSHIQELERRLTQVRALPAPDTSEDSSICF